MIQRTMTQRYKFYRAHKYVSTALNDVERKLAQTDFSSMDETTKVCQELNNLLTMLQHHAEYEDKMLHPLLAQKGSKVLVAVEADHEKLELEIENLQKLCHAITHESDAHERLAKGYTLYLTYRKFVGDNLVHLHEEETVILPELQRLYSDEELKAVGARSYSFMTPDDIVGMVQELFPHMSPEDHQAFLSEIKEAEPAKFALIWERIKSLARPMSHDMKQQ